jgi:hypothetical protein
MKRGPSEIIRDQRRSRAPRRATNAGKQVEVQINASERRRKEHIRTSLHRWKERLIQLREPLSKHRRNDRFARLGDIA